jgi:hypothetical protein
MRGDAFGCKLQAQIIARSPSTGRRERLDNGLDECCPLGIINGRCDAAGARPVYPLSCQLRSRYWSGFGAIGGP